MKQLRILVADDSLALRERIVALVGAQAGWEVVGVAQDADETLAEARRLKPDVLLLDLEMPGGGLGALQTVKCELPATAVVILTNHDYSQYRRVCAEYGADGFLDKSAGPVRLLFALRAITASLAADKP